MSCISCDAVHRFCRDVIGEYWSRVGYKLISDRPSMFQGILTFCRIILLLLVAWTSATGERVGSAGSCQDCLLFLLLLLCFCLGLDSLQYTAHHQHAVRYALKDDYICIQLPVSLCWESTASRPQDCAEQHKVSVGERLHEQTNERLLRNIQ